MCSTWSIIWFWKQIICEIGGIFLEIAKFSIRARQSLQHVNIDNSILFFPSKSVFLSILCIIYNWFWVTEYMNLKIKLTLQKIHSTTNILIFEKHVKDLIKKFKKMQLQIYGLDLSLKNTIKHTIRKRQIFRKYFNCRSLAKEYIY